ncbi:hypothetical protein [Sorangium sp. So ce1000]|uniref:hypothetical protein n=1 Tax=Sorangium sp. So ce1000 TaxID=3133325 RepID=UPI003F602CC1
MRWKAGMTEWSRGDTLTLLGVIVAVAAMITAIALPEIRGWMGLDPPTSAAWRVSLRRAALRMLSVLCAIGAIAATIAVGSSTCRTMTFATPGANSAPANHPSANQIVFVSERNKSRSTYVMNADGSNPHKISDDWGWKYSWSPDGQHIAFAHNDYVKTMDHDGSNLRTVADGHAPTWSPGGTMIAFAKSWPEKERGIYTIHSDGTHLRRLIDQSTEGMQGCTYPTAPAWSPNGHQIAFRAGCTGQCRTGCTEQWDIFIMNSSGTNPQNITKSTWKEDDPAWSPDGQTLAYASDRDGSHMHIYLMNADGSNQRQLVSGPLWEEHPSWSPDGRSIVFEYERFYEDDRGKEIYAIDVNGHNLRALTTNLVYEGSPTWSPR